MLLPGRVEENHENLNRGSQAAGQNSNPWLPE
jgi:hypothetical protein